VDKEIIHWCNEVAQYLHRAICAQFDGRFAASPVPELTASLRRARVPDASFGCKAIGAWGGL
jgi:hypothetical protein